LHIALANIHQTICESGYTASVRNVSQATKQEVMRRYGQPESGLHSVEIDHFVSLEIGGLNDVTNLWPQPMPEARKKDVVETWLKRQVCSGAMQLKDAQQAIHHWPELYRQIKAQRRNRKIRPLNDGVLTYRTRCSRWALLCSKPVWPRCTGPQH
jgi:hypothetical protein